MTPRFARCDRGRRCGADCGHCRAGSRVKSAAALRFGLLTACAVALLLPAAAQAAAPPNDDRSNATKLAPLPTQVRGTTVDATTTRKDPKICAPLDASVWYRIDGAPTGEVVLRLKAAGKLDAAIAVFRSVRSELRSVNCARTNDKGLAEVSFSAGKGDSFLILVGQRDGSDPGGFQLVAFTAEPPAGAPGDRLPTSGGQGTVNALGDRDDAWWVEMQAAQTYRINLVSPADLCVTVGVYRTQGHDFGAEVASISCSGYALYTPGLNGGGRYSLVVHADQNVEGGRPQRYRLQTGIAGGDDMGPGVSLRNDQRISGFVSAFGIDVEDLYRFDVARPGDLTLGLAAAGRAHLDLFLLSDSGRRITCACDQAGPVKVRQRIGPGHYYALVHAHKHSRGAYALSLLIREITSTALSISPSAASSGQTVTLSAHVATSAGPVTIEIDRFDPLQGWIFSKVFHVTAGAGGSASLSWRPPTAGRWRARAAFLGTRTASSSQSGYAVLTVA